MANHAAGHLLWFNSNGVTASSPALLGTSYPGLNPSRSEPQRGSGLPSHEHHWPLAATALRLFLRAALSQGRPCGANLGLEAPNAFGVKISALRSPLATMDRPVFNAVWYYPANAGENHRGHGREKGASSRCSLMFRRGFPTRRTCPSGSWPCWK